MSAIEADLVARLVAFCRALREQGALVTTSHAADAVRAIGFVGVGDRVRLRLALRCVLAVRPEDFAAFDALFELYFAASAEDARATPPSERPQREDEQPPQKPPQLSVSRWLAQGEVASDEEPELAPAASDRQALLQKDFAAFADDELAEIERIAARIARKLAARPGRRWKAARRGARIDLRRTVRRSLGQGLEPIELLFRKRKPRKTRLVALCDVSGSMDLYSRFLLQFLYALQGSFAQVESYVFATSLRRITGELRERPYARALRNLSSQAGDWSGGTRIGESLAAFVESEGHLIDRRTVVIILSDGWDTGDPALLSAAMEQLRARARRVIWLNPLLGNPGYQPLTEGMQAALPHVSVFAPAHNLASLRSLEKHLLA